MIRVIGIFCVLAALVNVNSSYSFGSGVASPTHGASRAASTTRAPPARASTSRATASRARSLSTTDDSDDDKQLVFSIVVNRHGERSPDADELSLSDQQEKIKELTHLEGLEGLTNRGKKTAYQIGKFYRKRYGAEGLNLISKLYTHEEISIRSTDKERTKMTVLTAMSAAYPPEKEQQWEDGLGKIWQPIPYTAVPLKEDYLRYYSNCKEFKNLMAEAKKSALKNEFAPYLDLIPTIKEKTGRDFTEDPLLYQTLFDLFRSTIALGLEIPEWAKSQLTKLGDAAREAYKLYFRTDKMKKIGGGVLLDTFLEAGDLLLSGKPVSQPLRIISSHDFNIGALMEVAKVAGEKEIPEYGAIFALELYKSKSTGDLSVLPVFQASPSDATPKLLHITGCEETKYCDYNKFRETTKEFRLPEKEFYKICSIKTEL